MFCFKIDQYSVTTNRANLWHRWMYNRIADSSLIRQSQIVSYHRHWLVELHSWALWWLELEQLNGQTDSSEIFSASNSTPQHWCRWKFCQAQVPISEMSTSDDHYHPINRARMPSTVRSSPRIRPHHLRLRPLPSFCRRIQKQMQWRSRLMGEGSIFHH